MSKISITIDEALLRRTVRSETQRIGSVRETIDPGGMGEVVVGRRRKLPTEKSKPPHGMHIANIFRQRGQDPFAYPDAALATAVAALDEEILGAIQDALRTARPQRTRVQRVLVAVAGHLAEAAAEQIAANGLAARRPNTPKTIRRKAALARRGIFTSEYGIPPPVGVATGRFIKGIRSVWHRGRGGLLDGMTSG